MKKYVCEKFLADTMQGAFEEYGHEHRPGPDCRIVKVKTEGDVEEQKKLREALANYAHEAWSGWMKHLFRQCIEDVVPEYPSKKTGAMVIPKWAVERWQRQLSTPYSDLPEGEKNSDREEADRMIRIMEEQA